MFTIELAVEYSGELLCTKKLTLRSYKYKQFLDQLFNEEPLPWN